MDESAKSGLNTPYDSAFKSIVKKCPRLVLFLINEMFSRSGLIDEWYDGTEEVKLLDKELPGVYHKVFEMDLRLLVVKSKKRNFHFECQSSGDGTVSLRMVQYETITALDEAEYTESYVRIKIDDSGIVFLRSTKNTPNTLTVTLEVPQGKSVSYQIPVIRMKEYTKETLIQKKLFVLLPFIFFNYEKQLKKTPNDKALYDTILNVYDSILSNLKTQVESGILTAYEASTLYDALRTVFTALGETNRAEKEVASIMGGKILEFSADKYFDAGKDEGLKEGKKEGLEEGETNGKAKLAILIKRLLAEGKSNDMMRALDDAAYRELLLKRYAIS